MKKSEKSRESKASQYWKDMAAILSRMKRFQKTVVEVRKKWGIPENGLPREKRADWYQSFFLQPDADTNDSKYTSDQNELLPPNKLIRSTLKEMINEFNLDKRWLHGLFMYIATGHDVQLSPPIGVPYVEVRGNDARLPEDKWIVERIWIEIYPDTTQDDIAKVWKRVEKYQAMMAAQYPKKRRPFKNVDKYIKIRDLEDQNMTQREIADAHPDLGFVTAKDVSEFKKQIEKHFSPKKSRKGGIFPY